MLPKLVITDIDGVWTDGGMYYTAEGDVMKRFSVKDGWGIVLLRELNIPIAIMTGENSQVVRKRAEKLKIEHCYLQVQDKLAKAKEICSELGITLDDVAFIGDDLNDIHLLRAVGFSASPYNTPDYVKREVDYVTATNGGYGAVLELLVFDMNYYKFFYVLADDIKPYTRTKYAVVLVSTFFFLHKLQQYLL